MATQAAGDLDAYFAEFLPALLQAEGFGGRVDTVEIVELGVDLLDHPAYRISQRLIGTRALNSELKTLAAWCPDEPAG